MERAAILHVDFAGCIRLVGAEEDAAHLALKTRLGTIGGAAAANQGPPR